MMKKYKLDNFLDCLFEWVDQYRLNSSIGFFSLKPNLHVPSLYGLTDMIFNLVIPNKLDEYLSNNPDIKKEEWIEQIQSFQNSKSGWFKDTYFDVKMRSPLTGQWEHSTAFSISALKLLNAEPVHKIKFISKLSTQRKVEHWLRTRPEWGFLYWPGSHRGGGIGAIIATLATNNYPHQDFFDWYFNWLDKKADPEVGFWRLGWNHKISKRLTKNELGGAVHYYWIYEYLNRPFPYPEKIIDSTLKLQNELGLWDGDVSYCIDFDAIFCLLRSQKYASKYREADIKNAIMRYLDYTIPSLNNKSFLFERYLNTHKLTGCLEAIAEIYHFFPDWFDIPKPWISTINIVPWI